MEMENNLPKGWIETILSEIADWGSGGTPKSTEPKYYNGDIPWLIIGDLNDGEVKTSQKSITKLGLENSSAKMVKIDSVLCAMYGSIGKLGITKIPCATNQAIAFTENIYGDIPNKFLYFYLFSLKKHLLEIGKGGTQQNISQTVLKDISFPLPPLPEQHRIVVKLETLFEKIESNKQHLDKIPKLLKRFRQSVLANAISGKLTEDWRTKNKNFESAKIKSSKKKNRAVLDDKAQDYELYELPTKWNWQTISDIADVKGGKRIPKGEKLVEQNTGLPYIKAGDIKNGIVLQNKLEYLLPKIQVKIKNYIVATGDILITNVGACIGDVGIVPEELNNANQTENALKLCNHEGVYNYYLAFWLQSPIAQDLIRQTVLSAAQGKLALGRVEVFPIPLPPLEEQKEIVRRVEQLFAFADKIEARYSKAKTMLDKLPQSILAKAFRGELVAQDPNDEPASVLLERIKLEKEKLAAEKKGKKTKGYSIEETPVKIAAEKGVKYKKAKK